MLLPTGPQKIADGIFIKEVSYVGNDTNFKTSLHDNWTCVISSKYPYPNPNMHTTLHTQHSKKSTHTTYTHDMHTRHAHTICTHDMHTLHVHTTCIHDMHTLYVHTSCTHDIYTRHIHTTCTHDMHTRYAHTACTHDMYSQHVHHQNVGGVSFARHASNTDRLVAPPPARVTQTYFVHVRGSIVCVVTLCIQTQS